MCSSYKDFNTNKETSTASEESNTDYNTELESTCFADKIGMR